MKPINILNKLCEEDHEKKPEDYTNASSTFDDIFLDGDFIRDVTGNKITYHILDDGSHNLISEKKEFYNAYSKDGYVWKIARNRQVVDEVEGEPIDVAKLLGNMNNTLV